MKSAIIAKAWAEAASILAKEMRDRLEQDKLFEPLYGVDPKAEVNRHIRSVVIPWCERMAERVTLNIQRRG